MALYWFNLPELFHSITAALFSIQCIQVDYTVRNNGNGFLSEAEETKSY